MMPKISAVALALLLFGCAQQQAPPPAKADEGAAIAALGQINQAQKDYFRRYRRYALAYEELVAEHFLSAEPMASGYDIRMKPSADSSRYVLTAGPADASSPARHLFSDQTGVIRSEQGKDATAESPAI